MRDHVVNWVFTAVDDGEDWEWQDSLEEVEEHMKDEFSRRLAYADGDKNVRCGRLVIEDVLCSLNTPQVTL